MPLPYLALRMFSVLLCTLTLSPVLAETSKGGFTLVTLQRNAVTLQVTDTIRSYELNFHSVPHGVTVSCERYTLGFPVCYGSQTDVFATSSGFVH